MKEAIRHYQIPSEPGRLRALGLALFVHLLLLGLLWFGVSWQSDTPVAVEAEIWNPVAREAAPFLFLHFHDRLRQAAVFCQRGGEIAFVMRPRESTALLVHQVKKQPAKVWRTDLGLAPSHAPELEVAPADAVALAARILQDQLQLFINFDEPREIRSEEPRDDLPFNRNLLLHINRLAGTDFALADWEHVAQYHAVLSRIEMHLKARRPVTVRWHNAQGPQARHFGQGETIHTENSYKYSIEEFQALSRRTGWAPERAWTDRDRLFSVHLLGSG